jgi:Domain of unknown function (DUF4395)
VEPQTPHLDERELRFSQGAIGALLLGAFVFQMPLLVLAVTLITALGAAVGPLANAFHALFRTLVGPRLRTPEDTVPAASARILDILATGLLVIACAAFAVEIDAVGWFFVLVEAAVAAIAATTGYNAAAALLERLRREQ